MLYCAISLSCHSVSVSMIRSPVGFYFQVQSLSIDVCVGVCLSLSIPPPSTPFCLCVSVFLSVSLSQSQAPSRSIKEVAHILFQPPRIRKKNQRLYNDDEETDYSPARSPKKQPKVTHTPSVSGLHVMMTILMTCVGTPNFPLLSFGVLAEFLSIF